MALHRFLDEHRDEILEMTRHRIAESSPSGTEADLLDSIPELYDEVIAALRRDAGHRAETTANEQAAAAHGARRLRLGFTIRDLVHDYGALCNAITEKAEHEGDITPKEYQVLNQVLDTAVAAAVTEYADQREMDRERRADLRAAEHLGFVAHELRNAISTAMLSFDAIRHGQVSVGGRTSNVLERSLLRLRALIDRSLTEVRLKSGLTLIREPTSFRQLIEEVEASITVEAQAKGSRILAQVDPELHGLVDRQLIISAVANLLQNAIKYSPPGATLHLRCAATEDGVGLEVEDQCGGLAPEKLDRMFSPFVRGSDDSHGLGLGLAITRRAVEAHGGQIRVRNFPGKGCVFIVTLPCPA